MLAQLQTGWSLLAQGGGKDVLEGIIQLAFVALFFGVPILRGILGERRKQAERSARGPRPAAPSPKPASPSSEDQPSGRDLWKQLLEGVEQARDPSAGPRPQDPMGDPHVRPEAQVRRKAKGPAPRASTSAPAAASTGGRTGTGRKPTRGTVGAPLGTQLPSSEGDKLRADLPSALRPMPSESELETTGGDQRVHRPALTELEGLKPRVPVSQTLGKNPLASDGSLAPVDAGAPTAAAGPDVLSGPADWRRAIVLAEVLGPPVALREGDVGAFGPVGLR